MAKLKVFRTPIGFHDAYVAAPSQKAALRIWGADADLFSRGIAELVEDPELRKAALKRPGEVIKVLRGSDEDHFKAVEKPERRQSRNEGRKTDAPRPAATPPTRELKTAKQKKRPRPSRAALDRAESAIAELDRELDRQLQDIAAQERALRDKRQDLRERHREQQSKLEKALARAREQYRQKIETWARE